MSRSERTATDAEFLAMKLRRENMLAQYKATQDEHRMMDAIRTAERVRNMQNQYGMLAEAHARLPLGLQGTALQRMRDVAQVLRDTRKLYPVNWPRGADPTSAEMQTRRRNLY